MGKNDSHTVKPAGKDSYDSRKDGQDKMAKIMQEVARTAGKERSWENRRP